MALMEKGIIPGKYHFSNPGFLVVNTRFDEHMEVCIYVAGEGRLVNLTSNTFPPFFNYSRLDQ